MLPLNIMPASAIAPARLGLNRSFFRRYAFTCPVWWPGLERPAGVEPAPSDWQSEMLP